MLQQRGEEPKSSSELGSIDRIEVSLDDVTAAQGVTDDSAPEASYLQGIRDNELALRSLDVKLKEKELELKTEELHLRKEDREKRREFARDIFNLIKAWLVAMGAILVWSGFSPFPLKIDSAVLVALVTTTNAAILGLFVIVATYFFYRPKEEKRVEEEKKAEK